MAPVASNVDRQVQIRHDKAGNVGFVAGRDILADIADVTLPTNQDGNKWNKHCVSQSS